jgi:hypothetical protein
MEEKGAPFKPWAGHHLALLLPRSWRLGQCLRQTHGLDGWGSDSWGLESGGCRRKGMGLMTETGPPAEGVVLVASRRPTIRHSFEGLTFVPLVLSL